MRYQSFRDRFFAHVRPTLGCWLWTGTKDRAGYGKLCVGSRSDGSRHTERAHRVAWQIENGQQPPKGLDVCHSCDNPSCVRADHLFIGTRGDNMRDCARKGRSGAPNRRKTHCPRGHPYDARNTYQYGVNRQCVTCRRVRDLARRATHRKSTIL